MGPLTCLALMITLEAQGEPPAGQYEVGQVILNRVESSEFPDTVCEVISQKNQFAPIVYRNPSPVAYLVATDLYLRYEPNNKVLWFYNPSKARPRWAKRMEVVKRIGNHVFLRRKS